MSPANENLAAAVDSPSGSTVERGQIWVRHRPGNHHAFYHVGETRESRVQMCRCTSDGKDYPYGTIWIHAKSLTQEGGDWTPW